MTTAEFQSTVPAMRILENEHRYLSYLMNEWHMLVLNIQRGQYQLEQAQQAFTKLRQLVTEFKLPLARHTEKEELYFFKLLGRHIGYEQGPIMPIENEHKEIVAYLDHFLHHSEGENFSLSQMQGMVADAGEAFEILTIHFIKEESVLFPMVAQVITKADQQLLQEQLHTLIV